MPPKAWHQEDPDALKRLTEDLGRHFPTLRLTKLDDWFLVEGLFPVLHEGVEVDRFKVRVAISPTFPRDPPMVFEIGGRVPQVLDRHVIPSSGLCCLFYRDEFLLRHPEGMPFIEFLEGPVRDYFIGQISVENGKGWPFGERAHGPAGGVEFYEELFGVKGKEIVLGFLFCVSLAEVRGHHPCPCGAGRRLRQCHMKRVLELRSLLPRTMATAALKRLSVGTGKQ